MNPHSYAMIVAANSNYLPGLLALVNSLVACGNERYCEVVVPFAGWDPKALLGHGVQIVPVAVSPTADKKAMCAARTRVAREFAPNYESLALFDADMLVTSELRLFFQVAAAGFLVAGNDDSHDDQSKYLTDKGTPVSRTYTYKVICTSPFFFSKLHAQQIFGSAGGKETTEQLQETHGDWQGLNLALSLNPEISDRMLVFPSSQFTGIHHTNFKPQTFHMFNAWNGEVPLATRECVTPDLLVLTADYQRVYSIHGPFWIPGYTDSLLTTMRGYYCDMLGLKPEVATGWMERARNITDNTQRLFLRHLLGGRIPFAAIRDQIHPIHREYIRERSLELEVSYEW